MKKIILALSITLALSSCSKNETTTTESNDIKLGGKYKGGIVAYILQPGDPGYIQSEVHGFIAAEQDQSTTIQWNNISFTNTGATATAMGTGLANTNKIIANQGAITTSYAAGLARAYNGGGFTDWYLPSKDELNKLYLAKATIGGFTEGHYWSSTDFSLTDAWNQTFDNGNQYDKGKSNTLCVRAIRSF